MTVGPVNRPEMSATSVSLRASLARRFFATLTLPPAFLTCTRRSVNAATVRPVLCATTIDPAPARASWSEAMTALFSALSTLVSTSLVPWLTPGNHCQLLPPAPYGTGEQRLVPANRAPRGATGLGSNHKPGHSPKLSFHPVYCWLRNRT